jgi:predicted dehydrogenase
MIRWGVIGLGNMATKFANSFTDNSNSFLKGIASLSNLEKFGKRFRVKKDYQYETYSDLLKSSEIDAVYISTVNNTHYDLIKEAIHNDKKILCEKPYVTNLRDAKFIYEEIKKKKISFIEAIAYRSHPIINEILSIINNNEIGEIKEIQTSFGFKIRKVKKKSRFFNRELGGGSILDLGCYPISFAELFRKNSKDFKLIKTSGNFCFPDVDNHAEIQYIINNSILVSAKVSFKENLSNDCIIYGSKKKMRIISPWLPEKKTIIEIIGNENYYKKFVLCKNEIYANQLNIVSNFFMNDFNSDSKNLVTIDKSYQIFEILDCWKKDLKDSD